MYVLTNLYIRQALPVLAVIIVALPILRWYKKYEDKKKQAAFKKQQAGNKGDKNL